MKTLNKRIPSLDGWRAIAILFVLGDHMTYTAGFPSKFGWVRNVFDGHFGVRIFFVLSGFIITYLLLMEAHKNGGVNLRGFYIRRVLRIFPVYFAYLGILGILTFAGFYQDTITSWVATLTFTRNMLGSGKSATVHLWSLAIEVQFYLLWPLAFYFFRLWKREYLYFILLSVPIFICPFIRMYFEGGAAGSLSGRITGSILAYGDSLSIGCIGAWIFQKNYWANIRAYNYLVLTSLSIAILALGQWVLHSSFSLKILVGLTPSFQAIAVLILIVLTSTASSGWLFKLLNLKIMTTLGILSYSIYIWQQLFVSGFMGKRFDNLLIYNWKFWLFPAFATAVLSYLFLEKPFFERRLQGHIT